MFTFHILKIQLSLLTLVMCIVSNGVIYLPIDVAVVYQLLHACSMLEHRGGCS